MLFARNDLVEINKEKNCFVVVIRIPAQEDLADVSKTTGALSSKT